MSLQPPAPASPRRSLPAVGRRARQSGFSLLETAVVIALIGFIALLLPRLLGELGGLRQLAEGRAPEVLAADALVGFAVAHDRLPCPDGDDDGLEDCGGAARGRFPHRTVGFPSPLLNDARHPIEYAVFRGTHDLAATAAGYVPAWPPGAAGTGSLRNALDFCQALRAAALAPPGTALRTRAANAASTAVGAAFVLIDPGAVDADASGSRFDGRNAPGALDLEGPARALAVDYDDRVHATGFIELAGRLNCPVVLSAVSSAIREANTAHDLWRAAGFYQDFRAFGVTVREQNLKISEYKYVMAVYINTILTAAMVATDLSIALTSGSGAASIAVASISAAIAVASAVYGVIEALEDKAGKEDELDVARAQLEAARAATAAADDYRNVALGRAVALEARGWFQ